MRFTASKFSFGIAFVFSVLVGSAQSTNKLNVVTTAVPFLRISPDARTGGMGDLSVATSPDANSGFYNLAKIQFNSHKQALVLPILHG